MGQVGNAVGRFGGFAQQTLGSVFSNAQEAISNFVQTGEFDFKQFIRGIIDDLLRLFTNRLFQRLLGGLGGQGGLLGGGGGGFGGGFGGGGLFGGGLFGGGLFGGLFGGFMDGGYTGNRPANSVAGVVHGREFVMPAAQTKQYRAILESMRSGRFRSRSNNSGSGAGGGVNVQINNSSNARVQARGDGNGGLTIDVVEQLVEDRIQRRTPQIVAGQVRNANSQTSKALRDNTRTKRRR